MKRQATEARQRPSRILIVDDHPIVREGLRARIEGQPDLECCGEADSVAAALKAIERTRPHLVLVDISLKHSNGLDLLKRVRKKNPSIKLLVLSVYLDPQYAQRALRAGAIGYVNKQAEPARLIEAIGRALKGRVYLSPEVAGRLPAGVSDRPPEDVSALSDRELQVFELIGRGWATRAIAKELGISVHTVDTHRGKIKTKLGLEDSPALVQRAVQWILERG